MKTNAAAKKNAPTADTCHACEGRGRGAGRDSTGKAGQFKCSLCHGCGSYDGAERSYLERELAELVRVTKNWQDDLAEGWRDAEDTKLLQKFLKQDIPKIDRLRAYLAA